ncbi:MAG: prepilin-type N-terminal cleavage/methylation domain-containing protein [Rhodospirillaceae bacterium]|nr:prepilin-type N-terminal cleavage/methylation domain-containing protein [Rhodospirillaceae bacterium]
MSVAAADRRAAGFTLIEIAIVLVVIGLLLSGGLLAISPVVQQSKVTETKAKIASVESALVAYAIANGCLPCPAQTNIALGAANAGVATDDAPYTAGCANAACLGAGTATVKGVVPWVNLGLSESDASDAFGNRLTYGVSLDLTQANDAERVGSTYPTGDFTVRETTGGTTVATAGAFSGAAYVVISHGPDGALAINSAGNQKPDQHGQGAGDPQFDNAAVGNNLAWHGPQNTVTGVDYFDDIVVYRSASSLIQACGSGSCGNPS